MTQHAMKGFYISMWKKDILFPEIFCSVNTYSSVRYSGLYPPPFRLPDIKCTRFRRSRLIVRRAVAHHSGGDDDDVWVEGLEMTDGDMELR
ncbi:hypothetical protein PHYPO_G00136280 [Pangasianodon hypophthalmus]|uniref:Uncharacterized protein n=1 Tax=Pangasianodon hypophthalmus TaxID=310915 RepID=A0A5N5KLA9_PANHP|nr:hypothetical protein PHYPO_G00136280 [Pangasianodon hypophthalmus]